MRTVFFTAFIHVRKLFSPYSHGRGRTAVRRKANALGAIVHKPSYLPPRRRFYLFIFCCSSGSIDDDEGTNAYSFSIGHREWHNHLLTVFYNLSGAFDFLAVGTATSWQLTTILSHVCQATSIMAQSTYLLQGILAWITMCIFMVSACLTACWGLLFAVSTIGLRVHRHNMRTRVNCLMLCCALISTICGRALSV